MKRKPTFDQIYRTFYYTKLLELGLKEGKDFKIINDSSQFQESDKLENFAIVMIKTYGGSKSSLRGLEATNLKLQILVDTDQPQKWKMIVDQITDEINGDWEPLSFNETEEYEARSFQFFQTLNTSNVISNATQVSTSTRHTIQANGNIFYAPKRFDLGIEVYFKVEQEYVKANFLISSNLHYLSESQAFNEKGVGMFKNVEIGLIRQFGFNFILDDENDAHKLLINNFLDGTSETLEMKIYISNFEVEKEFDVLVSDLKIMGDVGQNGALELTLIESGF